MNKKLFLIFFLIPAFGFAQLPTGDLLKKGSDLLNSQKVKELRDSLAKKIKGPEEDFDPSQFNYAIAFYDDAGLFEVKEKFNKHRTALANIVKGDLSKQGVSDKWNDKKYQFSKGGAKEAVSDAEIIETTLKTGGTKAVKDKLLHNDDIAFADQLLKSGEFFYASAQYKKAHLSFKKAFTIYTHEKVLRSENGAKTISNLGLLYHTTGRLTLSKQYTDQALSLAKDLDEVSYGYAVALNNASVLYKDLGEYLMAESYIDEAIQLFKSGKDDFQIGYALGMNNKAMLFHSLGRYQEAEKLLLDALKVAEPLLKEKSANYVNLQTNLAIIYQDQQKFEQAEKLLLQAIKIKSNRFGVNHPDYAHLKRSLAALYMEMGKFDKVESELLKAAKIYKRKFSDSHPSYASTAFELGEFYRTQGNLSKAEELLVHAKAVREKELGVKHPDYLKTIEALACLKWQQEKWTEANTLFVDLMASTLDFVDTYFGSMSEKEKSKFWDQLQPRIFKYYSFASDPNQPNHEVLTKAYNIHLQTKALILNSTNQVKRAILNSGDKELIIEYNTWLDQKENLARLYTLSQEELKETGTNLDSLEKKANQLERLLSSKSKIFKSGHINGTKINLEQLTASLESNESLVDIIEFERFDRSFSTKTNYLVFYLSKDEKSAKAVLMTNGNDLDKKYIKFYRNSVKHNLDNKLSYGHFWKPFDQHLKDKERLFLSLDGVYNQLNIATLKNPETGKFLLEEHEIVVLANAKDLIHYKSTRVKSAIHTVDLFGYPDYGKVSGPASQRGDEIASLPGTKKEIESISKVLISKHIEVHQFMEKEATETNLKQAHGDVLHVATHGFFLPNAPRGGQKVFGIEASVASRNPLHRCGLLLTGAQKTVSGVDTKNLGDNGIISGYEIMNMDLNNCVLAIFSACETGLGDIKVGEGVYGLQRSIQIAGAENIVMSLWKVDDAATQKLMSKFYAEYIHSLNMVDAFRKAQLDLIKEYGHPGLWGAFVMINQ